MWWEKAWQFLHDVVVPGLGWLGIAALVFVVIVGIVLRIIDGKGKPKQ